MVFLLHAGGAAAGPQPLHDPWAHSLGIARAIFDRWSDRLDLTHIGSAVALITAAPTAWRFLQHALRETYAVVRQLFLSEVIIPAGDPINRSVIRWVLANRARHHRSFTGRTGTGARSAAAVADPGAALKKTRHDVQYSPHWDSRWLWFQGTLFVVARDPASYNSTAIRADPNYDGVGGDELTISCFGWSAAPIQRLIETCREYGDRQTQYFVIIYARDRYGLAWKPKARRPIRLLETVHFDNAVKQHLLADMRNYLDPRTQRRYQSRSMPYRRGYLFYGPPGTGKSSLSVALAGEFGLDLYEVKIPSVASDADLEQMFMEIPPQCIVLLEDIDAVWVDRAAVNNNAAGVSGNSNGGGSVTSRINTPEPGFGHDGANIHQGGGGNSGNGPITSACTLSGLLNVLDGVGSQEGRIVIMTTNHPERLDSALVRPGRVDLKVPLGNISSRSAEEMFVRMFSPDLLPTSNTATSASTSSSSSNVLRAKSTASSTSFSPDTPPPSPTSPSAVATASSSLKMSELRRLASRFASHIPDDTFTPSHLQGFFQLHLDSPHAAAEGVGAWVERELLSRRSDREFEVISTPLPTLSVERRL